MSMKVTLTPPSSRYANDSDAQRPGSEAPTTTARRSQSLHALGSGNVLEYRKAERSTLAALEYPLARLCPRPLRSSPQALYPTETRFADDDGL